MRSKRAPIRDIKPDTVYGSVKVTKLINYVMMDGKRSVAQKQVYKTLEEVAKSLNKPPLDALEDVINTVMPQMEVRSRRVGGAAYQVPMPVKQRRGFSLAVRWLIQEARKRPSKQYHSFAEKLTAEMLDAMQNSGGAMQRKATSHRMAEANKAFAHFRW
jgi:small subunit ribosomal protein S7